VPLFDPPIEPVKIPYQGTTLQGFYMRGRSRESRRPLLILNNGSDGSILDLLQLLRRLQGSLLTDLLGRLSVDDYVAVCDQREIWNPMDRNKATKREG
jgi:hypothetical protein